MKFGEEQFCAPRGIKYPASPLPKSACRCCTHREYWRLTGQSRSKCQPSLGPTRRYRIQNIRARTNRATIVALSSDPRRSPKGCSGFFTANVCGAGIAAPAERGMVGKRQTAKCLAARVPLRVLPKAGPRQCSSASLPPPINRLVCLME